MLSSAQAIFDELSEDVQPLTFLDTTYSLDLLPNDLPLELQGARELLDDLFSGDIDAAQDEANSDPSEFAVDDFVSQWSWPTFA